jgi:RimJ/RimL family protein N-acetyltransferase
MQDKARHSKIMGIMASNRGASPLTYRRIDRADIGVLSDIELDPDQVERYLGPIPDIQAAVRAGAAHCVTGIQANERLIGFYVLHPDPRDNACWWLGWLALDRRQQGQGYGRIAMTRVMESLRRIVGCRRVRLLVDPLNGRALALYLKAGFRRIGLDRAGELVLESVLSSVVVIEDIIALLRATSVSKRARKAGRLRLSPGPHAGLVIGVERGPPAMC